MNLTPSIVYIIVALVASLYCTIYYLRMVWVASLYMMGAFDATLEEIAERALSKIDMPRYWATMVLTCVLQYRGYGILY